MKGFLIPAFSGLFVWFFATTFFVLIGDQVLFSPGTEQFVISSMLLIIGTALLLWGLTYIYLLFDKSNNAALKFGIIGTITGLALDTFSLSNHYVIFPKLDETQVIAFTAWMSFAYALFLFIPAIVNQQKSKIHKEVI